MFGLASFGLAMWSYSFITHDWGGDQFLMPQILRGFPQVFAVAPAVTLGLGSLPPERLKYASGLFNMMRNLGGAVGIAVCGAILNARTNFHFDAIASHLTPANGAMQRFLAERGAALSGDPRQPDAGHAAALKQLWHLAYREASTLAYADAFRAIMLAFLIATLLVPLLRQVAPRRPTPGRYPAPLKPHTKETTMTTIPYRTALIVGAGPGISASVARGSRQPGSRSVWRPATSISWHRSPATSAPNALPSMPPIRPRSRICSRRSDARHRPARCRAL